MSGKIQVGLLFEGRLKVLYDLSFREYKGGRLVVWLLVMSNSAALFTIM